MYLLNDYSWHESNVYISTKVDVLKVFYENMFSKPSIAMIYYTLSLSDTTFSTSLKKQQNIFTIYSNNHK